MSQTLSAATLLTVPLAPLAGSLLAGILGTAFGGNRIGRAASHGATILGVLVAIIAAIALTLRQRKDSKFVDPAVQVRVKARDRLVVVPVAATRAAEPAPAAAEEKQS